MKALIPIRHRHDVRPPCRETQVAGMVADHNPKSPHRSYDRAQTLIGMCMGSRIALPIPGSFASAQRAGGGNLRCIEFVPFPVAAGKGSTIGITSQDRCGWAGPGTRRDALVSGLAENSEWARRQAGQYCDIFPADCRIGEPAAFAHNEARPLRNRYPGGIVAPFIHQVRNGLRYSIVEVNGSGVIDGH